MYELLKSYEGIGKRIFGVEELKQILCVEDKYGKYANFKKKILLKSQEDLEKYTDIRFSFEEISETSRRVEKLAFTIYKNKKAVMEEDKAEEDPSSDATPPKTVSWHDEIRTFGVSQSVLEHQILNEYEEDYIIQTLKFCKDYFKTTMVKQKSGFFLKALQEGYYKEEIEKQQVKAKKRMSARHGERKESEKEEQQDLEKKQKTEELRKQFLTPEFSEKIMEDYQKSFMFAFLEKP